MITDLSFDIITPVFNQSRYTKKYLEYMSQLPSHNFTITVIDNGSTDETSALLKENSEVMNGVDKPKLQIISLGENIGFAKACNLGYSKTKGDVVIFLNNDVRCTSYEWYKPIAEAILNKPVDHKILVGPTGGFVDEKTFNFGYETESENDKINYLSGWCLAGRRETFEYIRNNTPDIPIGPFIERFTTYFEDTYMGFLARKLGIPMVVTSCPMIMHFGRVTSKSLNLTEMYTSAKRKFTKEVDALRRK